MAGVSFTLTDSDVVAGLAKLQQVVASPQRAYDALGAHFVFSSQRNIETETAPDGSKWRPLSPRTAAKRRGKSRRGTAHMLRVSARLYQSISYQALESGVEWGSNLVYARIHQLGGEIDMPERSATISLKNIRKKGNRFVKLGTRKATERIVSIRAHQVRVPARPYLGISAYDREAVPQIVADEIRAEFEL